MMVWRWIRAILVGVWALESLVLKLGWLAMTLWWSKFWAVRRYRRALQRAGLPPSTVQELAAEYDIALSDLVRLGWRRRGRMLKSNYHC